MTLEAPKVVFVSEFLLGVGQTYLGYGPSSRKQKPTTDLESAGLGFVCRLIGPLILVGYAFNLLRVLDAMRMQR